MLNKKRKQQQGNRSFSSLFFFLFFYMPSAPSSILCDPFSFGFRFYLEFGARDPCMTIVGMAPVLLNSLGHGGEFEH